MLCKNNIFVQYASGRPRSTENRVIAESHTSLPSVVQDVIADRMKRPTRALFVGTKSVEATAV